MRRVLQLLFLAFPLLLFGLRPAAAAKLALLLPLGRAAYQTNEPIDLSVVRSDAQALAAGDLLLTVTGEDGSKLAFTFPVKAVPVVGNDARATEHLHLNGWLLRPGKYTLEVACDGATAQTKIERLQPHPQEQLPPGGLGRRAARRRAGWSWARTAWASTCCYGDSGNRPNANTVRAGVDYMQGCTMGGGHQMDLRMECDWSDPYVLGGGTRPRRAPGVAGPHHAQLPRRALLRRAGPDLAMATAPPHDVPRRSAPTRAPSAAMPHRLAARSKPETPPRREARGSSGHAGSSASWTPPGRIRRSASASCAPTSSPPRRACTAGTPSPTATTSTSLRSLPIISGHGGYDDCGRRLLHTRLLPGDRPRCATCNKPNWYLPTWVRHAARATSAWSSTCPS